MSRRIYKVVCSQVCYGQPTSWTTVNPYLYCRILCYIMLYCVLFCCSLQNCSIEFYRYVISCSLIFTVPLQWTFSHRLKWIASWQILLALHVHSCSLATLMLLSLSRLHKNNMYVQCSHNLTDVETQVCPSIWIHKQWCDSTSCKDRWMDR